MKVFWVVWITGVLLFVVGIFAGRETKEIPPLCRNNHSVITLSYGDRDWHEIRRVKLDCQQPSATIRFTVDH